MLGARKQYRIAQTPAGGLVLGYDGRSVGLPPDVDFYEHIGLDGTHEFYDVTSARKMGASIGPAWVRVPPWTPAQVLAQYEDLDVTYATSRADLRVPVVAVEGCDGAFTLIDGWHRLYRAVVEGAPELLAYMIPASRAGELLLGTFPPGAPTFTAVMNKAKDARMVDAAGRKGATS